MDIEKVLRYYHEISHIPMTLYKTDILTEEFQSRAFSPNPAQYYIRSIFTMDPGVDMDVTITKDFLMCGYIIDRESGQIMVAGPMLEFPCTRKIARAILDDMGEPVSRADELVAYFERIPRITLTTFVKNMLFLNMLINGADPAENYLDERLHSLLGPEVDIQNQPLHILHNSQDVERLMLSYVEYGKVEELTQMLRNHKSIDGSMGMAGNDSMRSFKNVVVASIALVSRRAVKGGLDFETAVSASDSYLQKLETLGSYDEVLELWSQMFLDYTIQVEKIKRLNGKSKLVQKISAYVYEHIYERIRTDELAQQLGYNASYLCRVFKQDTQKNLVDFINETKIEEARRLLISSDKTIIEIAIALGYPSQTYFQTVFKKYTGVTPVCFRNQ